MYQLSYNNSTFINEIVFHLLFISISSVSYRYTFFNFNFLDAFFLLTLHFIFLREIYFKITIKRMNEK